MGSELELFLEMLAAERGAAKNTIEAYERDLTDVADFLKAPLANASAEDLRRYFARLARAAVLGAMPARARRAK